MVPFRLALFLSLVLVSLSGCLYGNGAPCQQHIDCASGVCCGFAGANRGVCRADEGMCAVVVDSGVPEDVGSIDAPAAEDAGSDAGTEDSGVPDTGVDAPAETDAGLPDSGVDDAGVDAL